MVPEESDALRRCAQGRGYGEAERGRSREEALPDGGIHRFMGFHNSAVNIRNAFNQQHGSWCVSASLPVVADVLSQVEHNPIKIIGKTHRGWALRRVQTGWFAVWGGVGEIRS